MSAERGHVLILTKSADWHEDEPYFDHSIECLAPEKCGGWQECIKPHEVDGNSATDGPWGSEESAPWFEEEVYVFHGVEHEWRYGYGWTVPFEGCVVAWSESTCDCAYDIGRERGEGRYLVDDDWDDNSVYLTVIEVTP